MRNPHVLIVDDSKTIRSVLSSQLKSRSIDVTEAVDGLQGLNHIRKRHYDLVITDVIMPNMDGYQLCTEIKNNPETKSTPVIILSTNEKNEQIEKGFEVGAAAYITKNKAGKELFPYVQEILDKSKLLRDRLILVVDDSKYILKVVNSGLSDAGFNVITASNGSEAYEIASNELPDLILSDINMPVMDGIEFCDKIQKNPDLSSIPFVIMSSGGDRRTMRELLHKGASAFLVKPFNIDQLVITAEKLLSDHFKMVLQQRELLKTERNLILGSITSLIQALEARDPYTRGHSDTVASISVKIAKQMSFNPHDLERIEFAARLHDLGKIGIRDDVLLKPGPLTPEEFNLIKQHPSLGAEILRPIPSMEDVIPAVLYHHEKMNGQGYPHGLIGNEIPIWARVIAVADVYDALTTDRPYRKAMAHNKAMDIITQNSEFQLCPECVKTFKSVIPDNPMDSKELNLAECI
ncbi:HDIG domain-containing protein [Maridesulfovibrio ferrireducens]|uniref:HDIG domain-containing protein n=1 Tax=Maridesulfovibrio ferrireducens TaxID=246191 RepID=A0A1G9IBV2_9BACT|nr:response regulator [Maridesulfovibrio ferrireducens]SDL22324.1 HDIG domain-containing protein [Maridesulfovibrio ferrireducens]